MSKISKLLLSLSLLILSLAISPARTSAAEQTINLQPISVSDGTSAFSEFYPPQYLNNVIFPMTSHPMGGGAFNFPQEYKLSQRPNSSNYNQASYMGLYKFNTTAICSQATLQSLTAKVNYTASVDSDPQDYNFSNNSGGSDITLAIWNGTQRIPGNSTPDLLIDPQTPVSTYATGSYVYDNPLNSAHQLNYTSSSIPAGTQITNIGVGLWLQQMTDATFDDVTINSLKLEVAYDDSACPNPTQYCPAPGNTSQVLTPSGDCDGDGITNQTEGYDPDGDGNPNSGTQSVDTDKDGIPDYLDVDSDNDKVPDSTEKGTASDASTNPADSNKDGLPDYRDPNFPKKLNTPKTGSIIGASIATVAIFSTIILLARSYSKEATKKSNSTK